MWGLYLNELIRSIPFFLKGLWMTILVSGLSLIGGTIIGFILGIFRAGQRKWWSRAISWIIGLWVDIFRGTPVLVQVFIVFFILPEAGIDLEAFPAAIIAMTNLAACFICEIVAGGIESVDKGQIEAAEASGLTAFQRIRYVVMPQAMTVILPPLVGQYVLLIKDSSIVSVIGLTDVTRVGWLTVQRIPNGILVFSLVGLFYFSICYPLINLAARLEKRMTIKETRL